jgi:hypothetical protein
MTSGISLKRPTNEFLKDPDALLREGADIARYLTGTSTPVEVLDRYVEAHRIIFSDEPTQSERSAVAFIRRHPAAIPYVDAACSLLHPHGLLRNKILLMVALIETTPHFADMFFPEPLSKTSALIRIAGCGLRGIMNTIIGLALYSFMVHES